MQSMPVPLWNVNDLARFFRTSPDAIYKMVERGLVPHIRLGRTLRFDPDAIRRWLDEHSRPSAPRER